VTASAERFQQPEAVLRALIESPEGMVIFALDRQYRYLAYNQNHARTMKQIWGVQIGVGIDMLSVIGRDDDRGKARANFDRALAGENFTLIEEYGDARMERRFYEDTYSPVRDDSGSIVGLAVYLRDITEQRRGELELERYRGDLEMAVEQRTAELRAAHVQLLHAQKLESLGVLAGGIAHDFNNLLAIMLARAELYFREVNEDAAGHSHISIIRDTAFEARMLTKQLLGYAGKGKLTAQPLSLNCIVQTIAHLLRASVNKDIRLELEPSAAPIAVHGDDTQLRQVLLNLVSNAAEAIGSGVGTIVIRTGLQELELEPSSDRAQFSGDICSGRYAYLEVEDTGSGISEVDRAKIFDPFFTTKFTGRGLGLAAVLGIVKGHQGTVRVESTPGRGSRFSVLLPAIEPSLLPVDDVSARRVATGYRGTGSVLVVDDEPAVRAATAAILSSCGYHVIEAEGGEAALRQLRDCSVEVDVVLLDLAMPGMNGEQTLYELKKLRPDMPVVLLTAYAEDELRLRAIRAELSGIVSKPFSYEELVRAVKGATGAASSSTPTISLTVAEGQAYRLAT
jgi:signal transduction histidine kinase/ActR/RegA family two-component response regulator